MKSYLRYTGAWAIASFLMLTLAELPSFRGDSPASGSVGDLEFNVLFSAAGALASTASFAALLGLTRLVFIRRPSDFDRRQRRAVMVISLLLGALGSFLVVPLSGFEWSGHDYENIIKNGLMKYTYGVVGNSVAVLFAAVTAGCVFNE